MTKDGSTKIANFMTPGSGGSCSRAWLYIKSYSENALFFFKFSSLLPGINQTKYLNSIDDQGRVYQNWNFYGPRGSSSCAKMWPYVI